MVEGNSFGLCLPVRMACIAILDFPSSPPSRDLEKFESFTCFPERFFGLDTPDRSCTKFLKPSLRLGLPEWLYARLNLVVEAEDQPLSEPDAIPQGKLHGISHDLIKVGAHSIASAPASLQLPHDHLHPRLGERRGA